MSFESDGIQLEGVLRMPDGTDQAVPCVLLIHGSLEHDRDGNMLQTRDNRKVHDKNFFLNISMRFCLSGYATFSWDRRGYGKSAGTPGDYFADVEDARSVLNALSAQSEIDQERIAIFGQSAGVYVATLLAKEGQTPALYILSGGLYRDYKDMMKFNYHRVRDYAMKNQQNLEWVEKNNLWGLAMGLNLYDMFRTMENGGDEFTITYKTHSWTLPINKRVHAEESAPKHQFRFINRPTLVIHGEDDLNVPLQDAHNIAAALNASGVDVELITIPGADHSFQQSAPDPEARLRERISSDSFKRPYKEEYFMAMMDYLNRHLGGKP